VDISFEKLLRITVRIEVLKAVIAKIVVQMFPHEALLNISILYDVGSQKAVM
jgi:hypothetical protein